MKVSKWISYDEAEKKTPVIDFMGGFFDDGMRWQDYVDNYDPKYIPYFEALKADIVEKKLKQGGDWHQNYEEGVPEFEDGAVAMFSYRAWGDLLAAIWSSEESKDYCYMDFYMDRMLKKM